MAIQLETTTRNSMLDAITAGQSQRTARLRSPELYWLS
jgi:hypothetical protein